MPDGNSRRRAPEIALSRYWLEGRLPADLRLTDGRRVQIIYRGVWSSSDGPDFRDAMIDVAGQVTRGAVEIHRRSSDWYHHAHDRDPAYNAVVLHVVDRDDLPGPVTTAEGVAVPTLELQQYLPAHHITTGPSDGVGMDRLGEEICLPTLAGDRVDRIRAALREKGWERLVEKQLRLSQSLAVTTASETLYRALLDALGYSRNRRGMGLVGERLPLRLLEAWAGRGGPEAVAGVLLGVAGFLPLSPAMQELVELSDERIRAVERDYGRIRSSYDVDELSVGSWTLNRVRPANHPARRLLSMASLIQASAPDGLLARLLSLPLDDGASWDAWLASARPVVGEARRRQIITNVIAPFLAAYAEVMRDDDMAEDVAGVWERLPGRVDDRVARATRRQIVGDARLAVRLALEEQGLHQIGRTGCAELRCFECPIAALAVEYEPWLRATDPEG